MKYVVFERKISISNVLNVPFVISTMKLWFKNVVYNVIDVFDGLFYKITT